VLLAAHATLALQAAQAFFASKDLAVRMQEAMGSRAVIEQAKGVLMRELACDADTAFQHLVERSQRSNTKLRDVAAQVVRAATDS
jgi:AmiR/NasT family two-component response regulator